MNPKISDKSIQEESFIDKKDESLVSSLLTNPNFSVIGKVLNCERTGNEIKCDVDISNGIWKHIIESLYLPKNEYVPPQTEIRFVKFEPEILGRAIYKENKVEVYVYLNSPNPFYKALTTSIHEGIHIVTIQSSRSLVENSLKENPIIYVYHHAISEFLAGMSEIILLPKPYESEVPEQSRLKLYRNDFKRCSATLCSEKSNITSYLIQIPKSLIDAIMDAIKKYENDEKSEAIDYLYELGQDLALSLRFSNKNYIGLEFIREVVHRLRKVDNPREMVEYLFWFRDEVEKIIKNLLLDLCKGCCKKIVLIGKGRRMEIVECYKSSII